MIGKKTLVGYGESSGPEEVFFSFLTLFLEWNRKGLTRTSLLTFTQVQVDQIVQ